MAERRGEQRRRRQAPLEGTPADAAEVPGWSGRLMVWMRVAAQLAAIQLLMIAGTVLGAVVLGVGPALAAGGSLLARLVAGEASDALWRDFWAAYRAQWRRAALVTVPILAVIGVTGYELLVLLARGSGPFAAVLAGAVAAVALYAVAALMYAPAVLRRYADPPARTLRFVALAPLLSPLTALACMVTAVAVTAIGLRFLPALVLAGATVPLLLTGILVDRFLDKVDARDGAPQA